MLKVTETNSKTEKKPLTFPRLMRGRQTGAIYLVTRINVNQSELTVLKEAGLSKLLGDKFKIPSKDVEKFYEDYEGTLEISNDVSS